MALFSILSSFLYADTQPNPLISEWNLARQRIEQLQKDPPTQEGQKALESYQKTLRDIEEKGKNDHHFKAHIESCKPKPNSLTTSKAPDLPHLSKAQELGIRINLFAMHYFQDFNASKSAEISQLVQDWLALSKSEKNSLTDQQKLRIKQITEQFIDTMYKIDLAILDHHQLAHISTVLETIQRNPSPIYSRYMLDRHRIQMVENILQKINAFCAPPDIKNIKARFYTALYKNGQLSVDVVSYKSKTVFIDNLSAMAAIADAYLTHEDKNKILQAAYFLKEQSRIGNFDSYWKTADQRAIALLEQNIHTFIPKKSKPVSFLDDVQKAQTIAKNPLTTYKELVKTKPITLSAFNQHMQKRIQLLHNFWQEFPKIGTSSASRLVVNLLGDLLAFHHKAVQEFQQARVSIAQGAEVDLPHTQLEMMNNLLDQTRYFNTYFKLKSELLTTPVKKRITKLKDYIMTVQDPALVACGCQILDILHTYDDSLKQGFIAVHNKAKNMSPQESLVKKTQVQKNEII